MSTPPNLPPVISYATPVAVSEIRDVALRQRTVMWGILAYIGCVALYFGVLVGTHNLLVAGLIAVLILAAIVTCAVFVFRLSLAIYSTGPAIIMAILTLIPYVGMLVLVIINGKATKLLRANGIKVGLMGANPNQIPAN